MIALALATVIILGLEPGLYRVTDEGVRQSRYWHPGGQWIETEADEAPNGAAWIKPDLTVIGTLEIEITSRPPWAPWRPLINWLVLPADSSPFWSNTVYLWASVPNDGELITGPKVATRMRYVVTDWYWSYGTVIE